MNADPDPALEEEFPSRLADCDEALAAGTTPAALSEGATSPELRARLQRGLACVQLLQQLRPPHPPENTVAWETPDPASGASVFPTADCSCPTHIGRFEIRRLLGHGGFGLVYLAHDPVLCREVALKIPRPEALASVECRARFQREARTAAGLDHPNLVPVYEAGQVGPICYIALAYSPGDNLAAWLKQRTMPVPCVQAARLVVILAQAVHYAHQCGVLHRDLKPSNVLLAPVAGSECPGSVDAESVAAGGLWQPEPQSGFIPRLTDFGLAKFLVGDTGQTQTGTVLGTPSYMAPEQTEGRTHDVGPATDVYALGAILYEVLTGRPPFWAETALDTLLQVKTTEPVAPSRLRSKMPRDLETICLKCLHKEPRKRYASAEALAEDLRRFLEGKPIEARPIGGIEQAVKWARRRPAMAAVLSALVLVTSLGIGGIFGQWQKTQDALADEARARLEAVVGQQQAQKAEKAEASEREKSEVTLYHHGVALAYREWSAGNVGHAAELLNDCRADLRNWEWRYVRRLCDGDLLTLQGHSVPVHCVVFSPDGRQLASAA